jgi:hypothetical protein
VFQKSTHRPADAWRVCIGAAIGIGIPKWTDASRPDLERGASALGLQPMGTSCLLWRSLPSYWWRASSILWREPTSNAAPAGRHIVDQLTAEVGDQRSSRIFQRDAEAAWLFRYVRAYGTPDFFKRSKFDLPDSLARNAAIPHLEKSKGSIVNTAIVSGMGGDWAMRPYDAAKGAVVNLTRALAGWTEEKRAFG